MAPVLVFISLVYALVLTHSSLLSFFFFSFSCLFPFSQAVVIRQGDVAASVYFVAQGTCKAVQRVVVPSGNGNTNTSTTTNDLAAAGTAGAAAAGGSESGTALLIDLGEIEAGWYFGERALFKKEPRSANVYCATPCVLYKLTPEALMTGFPEAALAVMRAHVDAAYPSINELVTQIKEQRRWNMFKTRLVKGLVNNAHHKTNTS